MFEPSMHFKVLVWVMAGKQGNSDQSESALQAESELYCFDKKSLSDISSCSGLYLKTLDRSRLMLNFARTFTVGSRCGEGYLKLGRVWECNPFFSWEHLPKATPGTLLDAM